MIAIKLKQILTILLRANFYFTVIRVDAMWFYKDFDELIVD
jgi:hypothetical protein